MPRESYPSPMCEEDFSENPAKQTMSKDNQYRVLAMIKKIQILSSEKHS
jgi:hypothetical protein